MLLRGYISTFLEQGMEEPEWFIFQDAAFIDDMEHGWRYEGLYPLENGQTLSIFDPDGSVLWSGTLRTRHHGFLNSQKTQPHQRDWHPPDVPKDVWTKWFNHKPCIEAELQTEQKHQKT